MIPCLCVDDKNRPNDIPTSKWVKKNDEYHVTYVVRVLPQNVLGVSLYEKPLGPSCAPYEYFLATRFIFTEEGKKALLELYLELGEAISDDALKELLENSNLETA